MSQYDNALTYMPEGWWSSPEHITQAEKAINRHMEFLACKKKWKEMFSEDEYKQYQHSAGLAKAALQDRRLALIRSRNDEFTAMSRICQKLEAIVGRDTYKAVREQVYADIKTAAEEVHRRPSPPGSAVQFIASCGGHRLRKGERTLRAGALVLEGYRDGR